MSSPKRITTVIFDLGGVVLDSPFAQFHLLEEKLGFEKHTLSKMIVFAGPTGPFERMERGEIDPETFKRLFEQDCAKAGLKVDGDALFACMANSKPRPVFLEAIRILRRHGYKTAAITNDWIGVDKTLKAVGISELFDVMVHSSKEGIRKPAKRIYEIALERLNVRAEECVFLDDIARNLKEPRNMGMTTIRVGMKNPQDALKELGDLLGLFLLQQSKL